MLGLSAGFIEHPFAQRDDEPAALGQRNEFVRRDHALFRMLPSDQCFRADDPSVRGIDLGLEMQHAFAIAYRAAQLSLYLNILHCISIHLIGEKSISIAP